MDCSKNWKYMMQEQDGNMPPELERDMLVHIGSCRTCADEWRSLQAVSLLLPEIACNAPASLWADIQDRLLAPNTGIYKKAASSCQNKRTRTSVCLFNRHLTFGGLLLLIGSVLLTTQVGVASAMQQLFATLRDIAEWVYAALEGSTHLMTYLWGPDWASALAWIIFFGSAVLLVFTALGTVSATASQVNVERNWEFEDRDGRVAR